MTRNVFIALIGEPLLYCIGTVGFMIARFKIEDKRKERLFNDGKGEIDFTVVPPGKLIFMPEVRSERFREQDSRILSNYEGRRLVRDMPLPEIVRRLQTLGLRTLSEASFKVPNTCIWLNAFREQEHDFGTLYAWASRYILEDKAVANSLNVPQLQGDDVDPSIKILQLTEPSAFNSALTHINSDVEPYARYIQARGVSLNSGSKSECKHESETWDQAPPPPNPAKQWIIHPLRIFPRRIWDLYSNRVIPFDWLVTVKHKYGQDSDVNSHNTGDPPAWGWRMRLMEYPSISAAGLEVAPFAAISHSWTGEENMIPVWTEINRYQWPVPFPKDASLDDLRTELLAMGLRYCWIDVLCLRQSYNPDVHRTGLSEKSQMQFKERALARRGVWGFFYVWREEWNQWLVKMEKDLSQSEELRKREWRIDVPTIGNLYQRAQHIVIYLNGLGRPLECDWETDMERNPRNWFRRAWTLQELGGKGRENKHAFLGGTQKPIWNGKPSKSKDKEVPRATADVQKYLAGLKDKVCKGGISALLEEMNKRDSTNQMDKVAGIVYLLLESDYSSIPVYDETEDTATAWARCLQMLVSQHGQTRGDARSTYDLLTSFPHPSSRHWYPSWHQLSQYPDVSLTEPQETVSRNPDTELRLIHVGNSLPVMSMLKRCQIQLYEGADSIGKTDKWRYIVTWEGWFGTKGKQGSRMEYITLEVDKKMFVKPIPDGEYTLIGMWEKHPGRAGRDQRCKVLVCTELYEMNTGWTGPLYLRKVAVVDATYRVPPRGRMTQQWFGPRWRNTWKTVTLL